MPRTIFSPWAVAEQTGGWGRRREEERKERGFQASSPSLQRSGLPCAREAVVAIFIFFPKRKRKIEQKRYISLPALTAGLLLLKKKSILTISGTKPNPLASTEASGINGFDLATRTEGDVILKNQSALAPPRRHRPGRGRGHRISGSEDVFAAVHVRRNSRALG